MIRGAQLSRAIAVYPRAGDRIPRISVRLHPTPPTRSSRGPAAYFPKLCRRPDLFVSKSLSLSAPIGVLTSVGLTAGKRGARTRFRISLIPAPAQSRAARRRSRLTMIRHPL